MVFQDSDVAKWLEGVAYALEAVSYTHLDVYKRQIFEFGILVFLVMIIADTVISLVGKVRYRTEMQAYERLMKDCLLYTSQDRLYCCDRIFPEGRLLCGSALR